MKRLFPVIWFSVFSAGQLAANEQLRPPGGQAPVIAFASARSDGEVLVTCNVCAFDKVERETTGGVSYSVYVPVTETRRGRFDAKAITAFRGNGKAVPSTMLPWLVGEKGRLVLVGIPAAEHGKLDRRYFSLLSQDAIFLVLPSPLTPVPYQRQAERVLTLTDHPEALPAVPAPSPVP